MGGIKNVFRLIGLVWLIAVIAIGVGGTWLDRHPESAAKVALAASGDPRAGAALDAMRTMHDADSASARDKARTVAEQWDEDRVEDNADQARRERERERYYGY